MTFPDWRAWFGRLPAYARIALHAIVPLTVLLLFGVLIIYFVFPAVDLWLVWRVYSRYVDTVANFTGLNTYLVTAVALLLFVPFYYAVTLVLYHSLNRRKRWTGIAILLVLGVTYNVSLYVVTRDTYFAFKGGVAHKFFAITPMGVHFFDRPGVDPEYGIALQPVTPENIRSLQLLQQGEFVPVDPATTRFFNPMTGAAELWFYKNDDGALDFYNKPGYHPRTGAPLQPVTPAIYREWKKNRENAEKERRAAEAAAEKARQASASARYAAEIKCRMEAEKRHPTAHRYEHPGTRYSGGPGIYSGGWILWSTATITNYPQQFPAEVDAQYEECMRLAATATP